MTFPRVLICGGRDFADKQYFWEFLDAEFQKRGWSTEPDGYGNWVPQVTIIHGGARGADTLADTYGVTNWCPVLTFNADWKKYGKAAGSIRNQQMLDKGNPDLVIAFPGGVGTADMIRRARQAGVEVIEVGK